jgi:hypothetical protein
MSDTSEALKDASDVERDASDVKVNGPKPAPKPANKVLRRKLLLFRLWSCGLDVVGMALFRI